MGFVENVNKGNGHKLSIAPKWDIYKNPNKRNRASEKSEALSLPGNVLLSQEPSLQVPSALEGLTVVFGMGTSVSPPPSSPDKNTIHKRRMFVNHPPSALNHHVAFGQNGSSVGIINIDHECRNKIIE
jgi:hypothetical protein